VTKTFSKCGKFAGNFSEKVLECPLIQTDLHNGHKTADASLQNVDYRSGGCRIFARGVRQLVPLECPNPLHALSPSDP